MHLIKIITCKIKLENVEICRFSVVTGHYSQMIWADTNRVGCGFTSYRDNGTLETNLYVCNYGPAGNFIGLPSYKVGRPCSQCPTNSACGSRFTHLCGTCVCGSDARNYIYVFIHLLAAGSHDLSICLQSIQNPPREIQRFPANLFLKN
jgi:hypothetical protein